MDYALLVVLHHFLRGVSYAEDKMKFSDYRKYFDFDEDGNLLIRQDFRYEIKNLKGHLSDVYKYILGEIEDAEISGAYSTKREEDCNYRYIPDKIRWDVYERDNFTCVKCGSRRYLSIDHILPKSKGGKTTLENCQTLCRKCNSSKGTK